MGFESRTTRARAMAGAFALTAGMIATGAATAAPAGAAAHGAAAVRPAGVVHTVSAAAVRSARAFWTARRMAAATTPAGHPVIKSTHFPGVPTVGTLFTTIGTQVHFCSASVVNSRAGDVLVTAAHCVYGSGYATNIEYVPQYHRGHMPFGAWPVATITVAQQWIASHNQNYDFAFLTVTPPAGTSTPIQQVTGGLTLGVNQGYNHAIEVIGYNNTDNEPIECATTSFKYSKHQMKFFCRNFQDGTSGGPWIINYDGTHGTGTVFGVIGGYHEGGDYSWSSYSVYFSGPTLQLFRQAQGVTSTT